MPAGAMSDLEELEEVARQSDFKVNERTRHQREPGRKSGWSLSPNIERSSPLRERKNPSPVNAPINPAMVADRRDAIPLSAIEARSMSELVAAIQAWREERGITLETLDDIAGWPARYGAKLLAPDPIKNLGWMSLGLGLNALAIKLVVVEDAEQRKRVESRWKRRDRPRNAPAADARHPGPTLAR
jgi:hypothetical protein